MKLKLDENLGRTAAVLRHRERIGRGQIEELVAQLIETLDRADLAGRLWIVERHRVRQFEDPTT